MIGESMNETEKSKLKPEDVAELNKSNVIAKISAETKGKDTNQILTLILLELKILNRKMA